MIGCTASETTHKVVVAHALKMLQLATVSLLESNIVEGRYRTQAMKDALDNIESAEVIIKGMGGY